LVWELYELSEAYIRRRIEQLREQMMALALEKGSFVDAGVVALSQQLDGYIVQLQRMMRSDKANIGLQNACVS
jgi:hypothetical protein